LDFLSVFFVNPDTKMNPNLNFAHFIPGVNNGTNGGIIDFHLIPEMLDSVALLRLSKLWPADIDKSFLEWMSEYLKWLTTSPFGQKENNELNNHAVWYDVQVSYVALHVGNLDLAVSVAQEAITKRIQVQIQPNGELPEEEARTKSWCYSEFCLEAFFHIALLSQWTKIDLWHSVNSRIPEILAWQFPFVQLKKPWPFTQVTPFITGCTLAEDDQCLWSYYNVLRIGANILGEKKYEDQICLLPTLDCYKNVLNLIYPKRVEQK